ncbi:MAG: nucleotide exchange factor GrpE [Candidatus Omnitrophica bacterium CG11_big_fil_rev_8_21_14_0_20_63_9]|nr:MAG: nucleotide exchange factor GrpE [Candidatus Omnitrophica bacterium CG11_big_fil_rev_8_21_14_0_20_63_9]
MKPKPQEPHRTTGEPTKPAAADATSIPEQLERELQQLKDQHLRLLADVENAKKRLSREKEEFVKYAGEGMVRGLLPIVDSLDQALIAVDKRSDADAVIKGVHLIYRQLLGLLEKEGVKRISTVGEPFDPHVHEAVGHVEAADGTPENTIVEEVHVGYTMNGKVLRPALVKVAKMPHTDNPTHHQAQDQEEPSHG